MLRTWTDVMNPLLIQLHKAQGMARNEASSASCEEAVDKEKFVLGGLHRKEMARYVSQ